jgi:hypothetical protein
VLFSVHGNPSIVELVGCASGRLLVFVLPLVSDVQVESTVVLLLIYNHVVVVWWVGSLQLRQVNV